MGETHLRQRRQTVKLGLIKVVQELFPGETLKTAYSIQDGVFCKLIGSVLSTREVMQIAAKLQEWVAKDSPIELVDRQGGYYRYRVGDAIIKAVYPANTHAALVEPFRIIPFSTGFIVDFAKAAEGDAAFVFPAILSETYGKLQQWLDNLDLELVPDVNAYITSGRGLELLSIAEALQEKEIADIADHILQHRRAVRLVMISGPSSSGKTTFAQRLSTQLLVNGLKPVPLSLDNYFVNREDTPRDAEGNFDFETLYALDLALLQHQLGQLIKGETVETPLFDFSSGKRLKKTAPMRLGPSEILVIEGIHALNPALLPEVNRNMLFKIYISALFELNVDYTNRVPTTEVRLLRRMVRGERFRGTAPEETLKQWGNVRRGEDLHVFKFREESDVMFNSSLLYEMNVLRPFAEAVLKKVPEGSPYYDTRERLLNLLSFFEPLAADKVPFNSVLREFIGGSIYKL